MDGFVQQHAPTLVTLVAVVSALIVMWRWAGKTHETWDAMQDKLDALNTLAMAQLRPNGGSSLMDLVKLIKPLAEQATAIGVQIDVNTRHIEELQRSTQRIETTIRQNNDDAKRQWSELHSRDRDIIARLEPIEEMAGALKVSLPVALAKQDEINVRVSELERWRAVIDRQGDEHG